MLTNIQFLIHAQDTLSTTASSYNVDRLVAGAATATVSLLLAISAKRNIWPPTSAGLVFTLITALYGVMMFATSYVEEEQHFWYWATSAWLIYIYASKYVQTSHPTTLL